MDCINAARPCRERKHSTSLHDESDRVKLAPGEIGRDFSDFLAPRFAFFVRAQAADADLQACPPTVHNPRFGP